MTGKRFILMVVALLFVAIFFSTGFGNISILNRNGFEDKSRSDYIEVIYPNGGEEFDAGTEIQIKWDSNYDGFVDIYILTGGAASLINSVDAGTGAYNWIIPDVVTGDEFRVRISGGTISDDSDSDFTIIQKDGTDVGKDKSQLRNADRIIGGRFSPNGEKIVFTQFNAYQWHDIWIMDSDGSDPVQLTNLHHRSEQTPVFSKDGSKIFYSSSEDGGNYNDIWVMDIDGNNRIQLTDEDCDQYLGDISPDGEQILTTSMEDGGDYRDIWIMDSDSENRMQITNDNYNQYSPRFSIDGKKIVYESDDTENEELSDIWIMNTDGTKQERLTDAGVCSSPIFNREMTAIAYSSKEDGGNYVDIWVMDIDGTNHVQLTNEDYNQSISDFNSDGNKIIYSVRISNDWSYDELDGLWLLDYVPPKDDGGKPTDDEIRDDDTTSEDSGGLNPIIFIIIGVIALVIIVAIVYVVMKSRSKGKDSDDEEIKKDQNKRKKSRKKEPGYDDNDW